jgi:TolA-binding protein
MNMGLAFLEKKQAARARSAFFALLNIFAQEVPREEVVEKIVAAYRSEGREEEAGKVVANWEGAHAFEKQYAAKVEGDKFGGAPKIDVSVQGDSVPEEERSVFEDALGHYRGKDYRNALAKLSFFLGKYPDSPLAPIASYRLGDCYYALAQVSPQYQAAVDTYQSAILQYPQSPLASWGLFQLANAYRHMEFYFEANENYARLLKDFPECAYAEEARFFMAEAFFKSGDFQNAYRGWSELLRRDPESAHAKEMLFGMGDCLAHLKRYREASETYHKTLERWPDLAELSPTTLFNMGRVHLNLGAYAEARRALFLAFNLFPEDEIGQHVMLMIGDAYFLEGQTGKALKTYSQVQPIYPTTEGALLSRLKMADIGVKQPGFYSFDQYLDPLHVYQEVIEKYPTSELVEEALYKKGFALSEQGKFLEALDSLRYLIAYYPESDVTRRAGEAMHGILVKLLDAYYTEKQYGLVVETYYRESEHLRGELPGLTLVRLGDSFCHLGLPDEALRLYQEARKRGDCPKDHVLFGEGRALSVKGDLLKAKEKLRGLIASFADSPFSCEARHLLGDVSFQEADFAEAASLYESALLCPADHDREAKSLLLLGHSHARRGRVSPALEAYERCLEAIDSISDEPHPLRLECQLSVADSLVHLKRYSEATSHYQAALDSDPDPEDRNWAFYQIASCLYHMGREKEATLYLEELGKQEDLEPLWNSLGEQRAQGFEWEKRYAERLSSL